MKQEQNPFLARPARAISLGSSVLGQDDQE